MTDPKSPANIQANNAADAIPEVELDKVTGGATPRKAGENPLDSPASPSNAGNADFAGSGRTVPWAVNSGKAI
jgi:hypothetical protein